MSRAKSDSLILCFLSPTDLPQVVVELHSGLCSFGETISGSAALICILFFFFFTMNLTLLLECDAKEFEYSFIPFIILNPKEGDQCSVRNGNKSVYIPKRTAITIDI